MKNHTAELPRPRRMIREDELSAYTGLGATTIAEQILAGKFPKPYRVGKRAKAWALDEILEWQKSLARHGEAGFQISGKKNLPPPRRNSPSGKKKKETA